MPARDAPRARAATARSDRNHGKRMMFARHGRPRQPVLRRLCLALVVALALVPARGTAPRAQDLAQNMVQNMAEARVSALRIGDHGATTRFVAELTSPVPYHVFTLTAPERVVIDLPALDWRALPDAAGRGSGLITSWRREDFRGNRSRLVLEVAAPAAVASTFVLPPQSGHLYRLVVDLMPAASAPSAPAMAAPVTAPPSGAVQAAAPPAAPHGTTVPSAAPQGRAQSAAPQGTAQRAMAAIMGAPPAVSRMPAPAASTTAPPLSRPALPSRARIIVLDPGHGGPDPGAIGQGGEREKRIVLEVARRLKERLDASGRYQVLMTRNSDIYIPLRERVAFARAANADLFVSIHADWVDRSRVRGASVYTLSEDASDTEAQELAARENRADIIAGVDLRAESDEVTTILIDLAQRETLNHAVRFARILVPELGSAGYLLDRTHRFAGFRVLKAPDVPSVLVELGYLSNRDDERLLASAAGQARLADALARAVDAFFAAGQG